MLTQENMVMPVAPTGNGGFGGMGDNGWWIILLFILLGGFGNNWGNRGGASGVEADVQRGFDQAALTSGIGDLQSAVCQGFAGVNQGVANGFAQAEIAANARQLANIQAQNNLQAQFANCCCENRLATANLQSTILSENCADRAAVSDALRDVLVNQNNNTQRILDQMCNDKIDAKNEKIADLERQLTMANLAASQGAQTAQILADNARQTVALEQYLNPTPVPAYVVANPNCCQQSYGCGCGAA